MKTVVIGLDGATFDLISPLMATGRVPVLTRLMREGTRAQLRSTILPNSLPGWASCTTGTSEGMHGIFSPFIRRPRTYAARVINSRDIMTKPVWQLLTAQGGRSLVVNVPTTYPPEPVSGAMVTGMLTPDLRCDFTYPRALRNSILAVLPGYVFEPAPNRDRAIRAGEIRRAHDMSERLLHWLLDRESWDLLFVVFTALDRVQHEFWADMDVRHPRHEARTARGFRDLIGAMYASFDVTVERILARLPPETLVLVVSDHGFCAERYEVRVNEALAAAGLLRFKWNRRARARIEGYGQRVSRLFHAQEPGGNVIERNARYGAGFLDEIDWQHTQVFFAQDKGVWVNLSGREPEGTVSADRFDDVIEEARLALSQLKAPEDGAPVFEKVLRRDEAFKGLHSVRMPDLVLVPRSDDYVYNERPSYGEVVVPAATSTGTHSRNGILIAWGRGVQSRAEFEQKPNLRDIGPTVLHSLGCPVTEDMDGRPLLEIFRKRSEPARSGTSYRDPGSAVASDPGKEIVEERLRSLGYLG